MKSILDKIGDNEGESTGDLRIVVEEEENDDVNAKVLKISSPDAPQLELSEIAALVAEAAGMPVEDVLAMPEEQILSGVEYFGLSITTFQVTSVELKYGNNQTLAIDELWYEPFSYMVRINGEYVINAIDTKTGKTGTLTYTVSGITEETFTAKKNTNEDYMESGVKTAVIPEEFAVMNGSTKDNGIVITDEIITINGNNYSVGNEFVWVPVPKAYITTSENLNTLISEEGTYPMAVEVSSGTYRGILYDFANWSGTGTVSALTYSTTDDYTTATYYREPAYLTNNQYADANSDINTIRINQSILQEEYNAMVESVDDNGGFYVARYEMSYNASTNKAQSQRGKKVARAYDEKTNTWYGLYYASRNMYNNNNSSVQSIMITGAQYDQIMLWMRNVSNGSNKYIKDSIDMGNYYDEETDSSMPKASGRLEAYRVKNVFDLAGNLWEWTSEAKGASGRADRGGYYDDDGSDDPASNRRSSTPNNDVDFSSRLSLYVKSAKTDTLSALTDPNGN